jgi:hypothetical protein
MTAAATAAAAIDFQDDLVMVNLPRKFGTNGGSSRINAFF